ncbi:amidase family protein [Roseibium algae]|uniref:Amidase family protein n=1 Tax=Roseibium algae TaxID=3123038 RepID=A0ABU8TRY0_9HYPH
MSNISRRVFLASTSAATISTFTSRIPASAAIASLRAHDEFIDYDALGLARLIKEKEITAKELTEVVIRRNEALNPIINCIATQAFERAREKAPVFSSSATFAGVPTLVKDMIDVAGLRRSDGSRLLATNVPNKSVKYIEALEASGLNIVGTTTVPEFASGLESELYGQTRNPWDLEYSCIASSSGAGAAVAAGFVPLVHGTDGGGSNRLPSHACGTFGFKPSRYRMFSGEADGGHDLFKTNNAISRTVRDSAALFNDTEDKSGKVYEPIGRVTGPSHMRLRIAYAPNGVKGYPTVASIREAQDEIANLLADLGHRVELIEHPVNGTEFFENFRFSFLPKFRPLLATVTAITGRAPAESGLLSRWTATMIETSRNFTDDQIKRGNAYFENAEAIYGGIFDKYDLLFTPVTPDETPRLGSIKPSESWDEKGHLFERVMSITAPTNAVGDCAIAVPLSTSRLTGMPVGSMFQAKAGSDKMLYELAYELEEALPWKDKWAPYSAKNIPV